MLTPRQINAERKKNGLPPLNFALFRKVIKKLETTPEAYDQHVYGRKEPEAPCGTAACIAGWGAYLGGAKTLVQLQRRPTLGKLAGKLFGLSRDEQHVVFNWAPFWHWPEPYDERWADADTPRQQARVAIRYLNHIIKTGNVTK